MIILGFLPLTKNIGTKPSLALRKHRRRNNLKSRPRTGGRTR